MAFSVDSLLKDAKVSLEKSGTDQFGAVVDNFARGAFGASSAVNGTQIPSSSRSNGTWDATSYAAALAGGSYRPKLKFLFKVQFVFTEAAKALYPSLGAAGANDFTFMIKTVDRPKIDFEYEEDVNMYNFRTKVLKKIRHRDLTVVFMDDVGNRVIDFFRVLMMIHSPITRAQTLRDGSLDYATESRRLTSSSGMSFDGKGDDSAHRAVVNSQFGNSIEAIRVQQIFVNPTAPLENASQMVSFDFVNPRIVSFDLDELTHDASDPNLLTMVFDYDWMEIVKVGALGTDKASYKDDRRQIVKAPGISGAPSDITPNRSTGATPNLAGSNSDSAGFLNDPISTIKTVGKGAKSPFDAVFSSLSGVVGRGGSQLTSDAIGKAVSTVAGNNRFAQALGGIATSSVAGPINGLIQSNTRQAASGLLSTVQSTFSKFTQRTVTDASTAGPDNSTVVSSIGGRDPGAY